ncbi:MULTISPECIES: YegP family protein [Pseudomonas]|jgi:uncharacterized protein YegP (UPF0339 family)|uniref:YegP family protein n=4 Tax=Pseudomonas chlororaphis TaxID=587753 RepID=A0AAQ1FDV3_9PSED|nr:MULTISPECIES: YegP family protein [Pseudomonas]AIC21050.1 hypothetical protein EY04_19700 [Pseudomonas chlororaphis]AIS12283.1 hypothetical protein JM49_11500 [Pseudomonas chlororaphis subsp. aurantiaca]AUG41940.1 DUF1508 domain-containing protein [Pseudomonas chlororaphis]AZD23214.1 hypothetical protein C4K24_3915 [Pseudomonas chlororaphis subsp. aurantiaca]AZD30603.1 hypothetical protein C4K23_3858 [Pseudomonas chlororaphis]
MSGWFELKQYGSGGFRFLLKSKDAQTMLQSDRYPCRESVEAAIALLRKHCTSPGSYEKKIAPGGKSYFNLKAGKEVILVSHLYDSEPTRESAIEAIMQAGTSTRVELC